MTDSLAETSRATGGDNRPPVLSPEDTCLTTGQGLSHADFEDLIQLRRERLAFDLGVPADRIKPCVSGIITAPASRRWEITKLLAFEHCYAGANVDRTIAVVSRLIEHFEQPPKFDCPPFTIREAIETIKGVYAFAGRQRLKGHGCNRGLLREFCCYGGNPEISKRRCPYVTRMRRPARRDSITTLLGAWALARDHARPSGWSDRQFLRRKFILLGLGALEAAKGYAGTELITTTRELSFEMGIPHSTIARDLHAMARAGWIRYEPGIPRHKVAGRDPTGGRIQRLLPSEWALANVQEVFGLPRFADGRQPGEVQP